MRCLMNGWITFTFDELSVVFVDQNKKKTQQQLKHAYTEQCNQVIWHHQLYT